MTRIGKIIRKLRKEKGKGQETLGLDVGLSQSQISKFESGAKTASKLYMGKLANALNASEDVFNPVKQKKQQTATKHAQHADEIILATLNQYMNRETSKKVLNRERVRSLYVVIGIHNESKFKKKR